MSPIYFISIGAGLALFLAPIILFSCVLVHPKFDKKQSEFGLKDPVSNPTPYISSFEVKDEGKRSSLILHLSATASFKAIIFNKKGKPSKMIRVTCVDTSFPCCLALPKGSTGIAFVEASATKKIKFDMELWKILVFPLIYAVCIAFGLFFIGYGVCGITFIALDRPRYFFYPTRLAYIVAIASGVVTYLIVFLCFFFNYVSFKKKEGK